jgi:hypothetical protein
MVNLVKAIMKGIDLHSFFYSKYYGPIKFRPLNNLEVRHVMSTVYGNASEATMQVLDSIRFQIKPEMETTREALLEASSLYDEINIWVVYHATKDFQPEEYQLVDPYGVPSGIHLLKHPDNYLEITEFANEVLGISIFGRERMASFIETEDGEILAKAYWNLNYPLNDKIWKLTDLQLTFLKESYDHVTRKQDEEKFDSMEEFMQSINFTPMRPMTKEELEMQKKWEEIRQSVLGRNKHKGQGQ